MLQAPKYGSPEYGSHLNNILQKVSYENKKCFVVGDFNKGCLKYQEKSEINNFYNNIFERGTIPLINKLTRVTTKTATIIDFDKHIYFLIQN